MAPSPGSSRRSEGTRTPVTIAARAARAVHFPEWPLAGLDLEALRADGWRPVPFREFVLKLWGRCNLACNHCYVFEKADQSWRAKPAAMSPATLAATANRIAEHVRQHATSSIKVVFHGGEPLLGGVDPVVAAATVIRGALPLATQVDFAVQTNGVLVNEEVLRSLVDDQIGVAVSVDGSAAQHDRHRRFRNGRGSHARVVEGLGLLARQPYRKIFSGLLCTVDLDNDPVETWEALLQFDPPMVDFILPHGNWTDPPPRRGDGTRGAPYADWLVSVFERWFAAPRRRTSVRLFEEIISLLLGGPSRSEAVGITPVGHVVVDTDGSIEQVDVLKSAYAGAAGLGLDVFSATFDQALAHPAITARQIGAAALGDVCRACSISAVCGGGFYPHRYRHGEGFRNPSVFCPDMLQLIRHIDGRVRHDVTALMSP
jgi:uncharacterized protein